MSRLEGPSPGSVSALLGYEEARRLIYLPAYRWMLDHRAAGLITRLRELASHQTVILLDYTTNGDITTSRPRSPTRPSSRGASKPGLAQVRRAATG
jgi:uncharacterized protein DUF6939